VVLKDEQGDQIDIAVVLASTDPNLDITTAAGPAAGAQGADNTGALLSAFDGAGGLGGLNAVGVLDATALQYKLIDNNIRLDRDDELSEPNEPLGVTVIGPAHGLGQAFLRDPIVTINQYQGHFTFNDFINGFEGVPAWSNHFADYDGTKAGQADAESVHVTGEIIVDPHNTSTVDVRLNLNDLNTQNLTSNGVPLTYVLSQDGTTIFGFRGDGSGGTGGADGALVLVIHVQDVGTKNQDGTTHFLVDYYLVNRIDDVTGAGTGTHINVDFDVTTSFEQTGSGTTGVDYLDDAPIAADDGANVANNSGITISAADGVEKNDLFGADGKIGGTGGVVGVHAGGDGANSTTGVGTDIKGDFGTLHLNADGSYTYTRFDDSPTLDKDGKTVIQQVDKFTYSIKDDDGDIDSAVLTITIKDNPVIITPPPPPGGGDNPIDLNKSGTAVFESGLPDGSKSADNTETTAGTVKVKADDGVATVTVDGKNVALDGTPTVITGTHGDITVTWDKANNELDYTYTLKDNDLGHTKSGNDIIPGEDFKVVVTDKDGDKSSGDINIVIVDDVPQAKDDVDTIATGGTTATGNVVTGVDTTTGAAGKDVLGADGAKVSAVTGFNGSSDSDASNDLTVDGQYGKLVLKADGSYTYTRDAGSPGGVTDVFTYTLKDGDGDTSTATLTINVGDDKPTVDAPDSDGMTKVFEKGLPEGSGEMADGNSANNSDKSEVVSGTITYTEGDAPAAITITGKDGKEVAVTVGATIVGADGTLVITSVGGGNIGYTYTLTTNTDGDATHDDFKVSITDKDGDNATDTLKINIVDDVPTAKNDTDSVGNQLSTDGNVITGVGTTSGNAGLDLKGADGATVSALVGSKSSDGTAADGLTVQGDHGKLVMNADGTYTYTRDNGDPLKATDTFTYTLKDGDGDTSTATLTINIDDSKIEIKDLNPKTNGGDTTVDEDGLLAARGPGESAGSDGSGPVKGDGDFTVSAPDGVGNVSVGGHDVVVNGVFTATSWTTPLGNTMSVTAYDPATGKITYNYVLNDNENHASAGGENSLFEDFTVTVTDKDGDAANGTLSVNIVDDVPTAKNDTDTVDNATNTATGNVVTGANTTSGAAGADVKGADGATVTGLVGSKGSDTDASNGLEVQGTYGKLVMNADGTYTYTRDAGTPGGASESFTYTLTDGDGDTSTATLTVGIQDKNPDIDAPTAAGETTVYEKGLPQGSGEFADGNANNQSDKSEIVSGTIKYDEGDAPASITIQGKDGPVAVTVGATIVGADGTLVINSIANGSIGYTYTLTTNTSGDNTTDSFKLSITDKDGDNATDNLVIKIVDDVPHANPDTDSVGTKLSTDGNVITGVGTTSGAAGIDLKGADGATVSAIGSVNAGGTDNNAANGLSIAGQYGTLVMNTDGSYTYTRFNDAPLKATDVFNYTLTDGDGDTSTTTLSVKIEDGGCEITNLTPKANGGDTLVDEDGLLASRGANESAGSDGSGPTKGDGDFTITAPDGVGNLSVDGHSVIANGVFTATTFQTTLGNTMSITNYDAATGKITYNYTLTDNEAHESGKGENSLYEDLAVKLTDKDGDAANGTLSVNIVDDVAVAKDGAKVLNGTDQKTNVLLIMDISGSMADDSGVDNPAAGQGNFTRLQLEGQTIINILNAYAAAGETMVQIATFSTDGNVPNLGGGWMSVKDAIALVNQIVANGPQNATDYHDALTSGQQAFNTDGKITGADNVAYFFSDGKPNEPNEAQGPIGSTEQANWESFLNQNDVKTYAIGLGPDVSATNLNPIAYDGSTGQQIPSVIVTDLNDLADVINATLPQPQGGNIVSETGAKFGADGGHIASITINGVTHTFAEAQAANAQHELTIATGSGKLVIDMDDGKYTYAPDFSKTQLNLDIGFVLLDNDGDSSATGHLKLLAPLVEFAVPTEVLNPPTTTNVFGTGNYTVPAGTSAGDHIRDWVSGGSAADVHDSTLNGNNGNDWIEAGAGNDTVNGGTGLDKLLGGAGNDNLQGDTADDWLDGGTGNDWLQGGNHNDVLIGGDGSDKMDGGSGTDYILKVDAADLNGTNTLDGTHTINGGDGSDYVDLSGLASFGSSQAARIENVEALSFNGGSGTAVTLDYNSVLSMTDANNNLVIHGDQNSDSVALSGGFTKIGADVTANDGQHYDVFQAGAGANQVTVFVDHNLNATAN
jgi:VCBS repeat-containing protein